MAVKQIANLQLTLNNVHISYVPNTLVYTEGFGEQNVRVRTGGSGTSETVFSDNAELKKSMIKFSMYPVDVDLDFIRGLKILENANTISIIDQSEAGGFSRHFPFCSLINNYEVNASFDGVVELEFESDPAI